MYKGICKFCGSFPMQCNNLACDRLASKFMLLGMNGFLLKILSSLSPNRFVYLVIYLLYYLFHLYSFLPSLRRAWIDLVYCNFMWLWIFLWRGTLHSILHRCHLVHFVFVWFVTSWRSPGPDAAVMPHPCQDDAQYGVPFPPEAETTGSNSDTTDCTSGLPVALTAR